MAQLRDFPPQMPPLYAPPYYANAVFGHHHRRALILELLTQGLEVQILGPLASDDVYDDVSLPRVGGPPRMFFRKMDGGIYSYMVIRKRYLEPYPLQLTCSNCKEQIGFINRVITDNFTWVFRVKDNQGSLECSDRQFQIVCEVKHYCPKCGSRLGTYRYEDETADLATAADTAP